jgi:hypothetical protein
MAENIKISVPSRIRTSAAKRAASYTMFPAQTQRKVKLSLRLVNKALCHDDVWGSEGTAPPFLTTASDGGEWSATLTSCFTPREIAPGTHWIGGWVGPRAGLDAVEKRRISCPCRESNPGSQARNPSLY